MPAPTPAAQPSPFRDGMSYEDGKRVAVDPDTPAPALLALHPYMAKAVEANPAWLLVKWAHPDGRGGSELPWGVKQVLTQIEPGDGADKLSDFVENMGPAAARRFYMTVISQWDAAETDFDALLPTPMHVQAFYEAADQAWSEMVDDDRDGALYQLEQMVDAASGAGKEPPPAFSEMARKIMAGQLPEDEEL